MDPIKVNGRCTLPARAPRDPNEKPRIELFREMARELECDEIEQAFKAKLAQIMRHKPKGIPTPSEE